MMDIFSSFLVNRWAFCLMKLVMLDCMQQHNDCMLLAAVHH